MHLRTLLSAFNIQPGEGLPVALLLSHSFFMGLAGVLFYTAASALFLAAFAPDTLPYVYIASAGFVALGGFLYAKLEAWVPVSRLLPATLVFLILSVVGWRLGLWLTNATWLAFGLMFWLRVLVVLTLAVSRRRKPEQGSWIGTRRVAPCTFPHPLRLEPGLRLLPHPAQHL